MKAEVARSPLSVGAVAAHEGAASIGDMSRSYFSDDDVVVTARMRCVEPAPEPRGGVVDHRAVLLERMRHSGELRRPANP